jgi:hypothetical protein
LRRKLRNPPAAPDARARIHYGPAVPMCSLVQSAGNSSVAWRCSASWSTMSSNSGRRPSGAGGDGIAGWLLAPSLADRVVTLNCETRLCKQICSRGAFRPSSASQLPPLKSGSAGKAGCPLHPGDPAQKIFARTRRQQLQARREHTTSPSADVRKRNPPLIHMSLRIALPMARAVAP